MNTWIDSLQAFFPGLQVSHSSFCSVKEVIGEGSVPSFLFMVPERSLAPSDLGSSWHSVCPLFSLEITPHWISAKPCLKSKGCEISGPYLSSRCFAHEELASCPLQSSGVWRWSVHRQMGVCPQAASGVGLSPAVFMGQIASGWTGSPGPVCPVLPLWEPHPSLGTRVFPAGSDRGRGRRHLPACLLLRHLEALRGPPREVQLAAAGPRRALLPAEARAGGVHVPPLPGMPGDPEQVVPRECLLSAGEPVTSQGLLGWPPAQSLVSTERQLWFHRTGEASAVTYTCDPHSAQLAHVFTPGLVSPILKTVKRQIWHSLLSKYIGPKNSPGGTQFRPHVLWNPGLCKLFRWTKSLS